MSSDDWPVLSLREAGVELVDCEHRTPPDAGCGYPYIAIPQIRDGHLDLSGARRVSHEHYVEWTRKAKPQPHDVLLSRRCNPGETAVVPSNLECVLGQNLVILRADGTRIAPSFLRWLVRSPVWWEQVSAFINVGAVFDSLRCADIPSFRLPIPPESEQLRIAAILDALDDRIELNRRMNRTLESMARAIFKSWFVDFDPVRTKMEGGEGGEVGEVGEVGLPPALADLFPCSFEGSELGEIPKGWEMGTLADVTTLNPESRTKATRSTLINYVDLSNTKWGRIESVTTHAGDDAPSRAQRVLRSGDTIVGTVRPGNGSYALVSDDGLTGSTGFAVLRPMNTVYAQYVYLAATAVEKIEALSRLADGGAYPAVRPEAVAATAIIRPSNEVLAAFSRVAGPLLGKLARNERQSRNLATLRDALLPKLVSGELLVSPAKRVIPGVDA